MKTVPNPLIAFPYLVMAEQFLFAYQNAAEQNPPNWPKYFLGCHAVELAFKSFLFAKGTTEKELEDSKVRHNLLALLKLAEEKGLMLSAETVDGVAHLAQAHSNFWNRYPKFVKQQVVLSEELENEICSLFQVIRTAMANRSC